MRFKFEICGEIEEIAEVVNRIQDIKGLDSKDPIEKALEPLVEAVDGLGMSMEEVASAWRGDILEESVVQGLGSQELAGTGDLCE